MSLRVCCSQVLLVPAVHVPHSAVLHLLWGGLCGHHPQSHGGCHPLWSLLWSHEPVRWLCDTPARVPRLVDLGKTTILLFACHHIFTMTMVLSEVYLPSHSLTHSFIDLFVCSYSLLFIQSYNMCLFCQYVCGQLQWFCAVPVLFVMLAFQAGGLGLHSICSHGRCMHR